MTIVAQNEPRLKEDRKSQIHSSEIDQFERVDQPSGESPNIANSSKTRRNSAFVNSEKTSEYTVPVSSQNDKSQTAVATAKMMVIEDNNTPDVQGDYDLT